MAHSLRRGTFFATLALLVLGAAPLALAQTTPKPKKKGAKPAATAPATDAAADAAPPPAAPSSEPAKPVEPPTPPAASESDTSTKPATAPAEAGTESVNAAYDPSDITYTREDPTKSYTFIGARYRGTIIPAFLEHLFVDDGATVYSNTIGAEVDFRRDGKSNILWLAYQEFGLDPTLFFQKGATDVPQNYSIVSSSLKGIFIGLDEQWSAPIADHVDFEYGFGLGLGAIFGTLYNSWVYQPVPGGRPGAGAIQASNGQYYTPCGDPTNTSPDISMNSCNGSAHSGSTENKTGRYSEKNWFQGGPVPVVFPHIAGNIGVRYKPIKQLQTRFDLGIALTGFWFGISADYGLEKTKDSGTTKPAMPPAKEQTPGSGQEPKSSRAYAPPFAL